MPAPARPAVLLAEAAAAALWRGFSQVGDLLGLTLGPARGHILTRQQLGRVEALGDSATIARRLLALPDAAESVGAMLMRNLAWRVHQRAGDGVATAAVLAQAIAGACRRLIAASANPMALRLGVEAAAAAALAHLRAQARPVAGEEELTAVAHTVTGHERLALILGELFALLGPDGQVSVEDYAAPYLDRAYDDGLALPARLASPHLISDAAGARALLNDCAVALYAGPLTTAAEVAPLLGQVALAGQIAPFGQMQSAPTGPSAAAGRSGPPRLLLAADSIGGEALATLVLNHQRRVVQVVAVEMAGLGDQRRADLDDLTVLTGGRLLRAAAGERLSAADQASTGRARRVEADATRLLVSGGKGDPALRRQRIAALRDALAEAGLPESAREGLRQRLARLSGGAGILRIGAHTGVERARLRREAERAMTALRYACREGTAPGGGLALLRAAAAARESAAQLSGDAALGAQALARALAAPLLRLAQNYGRPDPQALLAELRRRELAAVYDLLAGTFTPADDSPLRDPVGTLAVALETAASGAATLITTDALILRRAPELSYEP